MRTLQIMAAGLLLGAIAQAIAEQPAANTQRPAQAVSLNISAQPLGDALAEFAQQAGLQLVFYSSLGDGIRAPALKGNFTPELALQHLLEKTSLRYEFLDAQTVAIRVRKPGTMPIAQGESKRLGVGAASGQAGGGHELRLAQATVEDESKTRSRTETSATAGTESGSDLTVTGTRLRSVVSHAPMQVIDREEIRRRGFNTMEDIVRALSSNFTDLNVASSTNVQLVNPMRAGNVTFNLRGLGARNSLVLLNGRRLTGSASFDGNGVNVGGIPVSAIERIEVVTDGGSAIYGSDAVAGTVNIILRKNFVGSETSLRVEESSNDGDAFTAGQMVGIGWGSGNLTANLSYQKEKPIDTYKAGHTTMDLSYLPSGWDQRPGANYIQLYEEPYTYGWLPPGTDLGNFTADDVREDALQLSDVMDRYLSPETKRMGFWTSVQQQIGERLVGNLDLSYTRTQLFYESTIAPYYVTTLAPDSPLNPTGVTFQLGGSLTEAVESGALGYPGVYGRPEEMSVGLGLGWNMPWRDWRLQTDASYGTSKQTFALTNRMIVDADYVAWGLEEAIANGTFDPFTGVATSPDVYASFMGRLQEDTPSTELGVLTGYVEGRIADIPTGQMRAVLGGEYRMESQSGFKDRFVIRPTRDISAAFSELSLPVMNEKLDLKLAARWERYQVRGSAFTGSGSAKVDETFTHTSPSAQLLWRPFQTLQVNASWSESFRAPGASNLFSGATLSTVYGPSTIIDPLKPGTGGAGGPVAVNFYFAGNERLQPEISRTTTLSAAWSPQFLRGLYLSAAYSDIDFSDRIANPSTAGSALQQILLDPETYPGFAARDANGNLLAFITRPLNLAMSVSRSIDVNSQYTADTRFGTFTAGVLATYMLERKDQNNVARPPNDLRGTDLDVIDRFKGAARLDWERSHYGASLIHNFASDYDDMTVDYTTGQNLKQGVIKGLAIWDLTGFYRVNSWRFSMGAKNLLDAKPPAIYLASQPFDARRFDLHGRTVFAEVVKSFD